MNTEQALNEAIASIGLEMNESYEGDELNDPSIKAWMANKQAAIDALIALKKVLYSPC
jgi:hypothetical protein